jgi:hypothetical protein
LNAQEHEGDRKTGERNAEHREAHHGAVDQRASGRGGYRAECNAENHRPGDGDDGENDRVRQRARELPNDRRPGDDRRAEIRMEEHAAQKPPVLHRQR